MVVLFMMRSVCILLIVEPLSERCTSSNVISISLSFSAYGIHLFINKVSNSLLMSPEV